IVTLWKGVLPQIDEIIELAEKYRALLHFNALIPVGRAKNNFNILLNREENEEVYEKLKGLRVNREAFQKKIWGALIYFAKGGTL
ncbi:MAG: hypothetical protein JRF22_06295, partial [Deltaproteobacteria bacterium]|nr:hypothetical protein [Deltaproteobacteria bacterium]